MPQVLSLLRKAHPLADPRAQLEILAAGPPEQSFDRALATHGFGPLRAETLNVLQLNVGKLCNQTCRHCHVDAGPDRREVMSRETMRDALTFLESARIPILDITGGAPELNPHFRWLVIEARRLGARVIDRCNLTVLLIPGQQDLAAFLAEHHVEIVASLPCYLPQNTDAQRGEGVFERSIAALRRLNSLGYGQKESGLVLNLVFNPLGPQLPPPQEALETAYRRELAERYQVVFNRLLTLTNMPISRFLEDLLESGNFQSYMQLLSASFNPATVPELMCRTMLSVGWDGRLYDCDFNQMLGLPFDAGRPQTIRDLAANPEAIRYRHITTARHCFGCTAGAGSSCQGALAEGTEPSPGVPRAAS